MLMLKYANLWYSRNKVQVESQNRRCISSSATDEVSSGIQEIHNCVWTQLLYLYYVMLTKINALPISPGCSVDKILSFTNASIISD